MKDCFNPKEQWKNSVQGDYTVVLASASPRRKELLEQIGLEFSIITSDCDESSETRIASDLVEELAIKKAQAVLDSLTDTEHVMVIGADTVVVSEGKILGKPSTKEAACEMLQRLQGTWHLVYTGVSIVFCNNGEVIRRSFHEETKVKVAKMTEQEILAYVNLDTCMDKAGAYGIQNEFAAFIEGIQGDYQNVVGLPVCRLYQELQQIRKMGE